MTTHVTTAACWIVDHLKTDSRKYDQAVLEFAGLLIEARHNAQRRTYMWFLDGRESTCEAVESAIDRRLNS